MTPASYFRMFRAPRATAAILATGIASLLQPGAARAATYYWDTVPSTVAPGNDLLNGGTGTWDVTTANFTTSATDSSGVNHNVWSSVLNNLGTDSVIFAGATGGTVTLNAFASGAQLTGSTSAGVSNLTFNATTDATSYTLAGTNALRFIGTGSITVASGVTAAINLGMTGAAISGYTVDGTVDMNGGGLLRLGGANGSIGFNVTGGTTVEVTGGSFSGFNLSTFTGSTLRTTANNVLQAPGSLNGVGGLFDINGTTQTTGTISDSMSVTNSTSTGSAVLNLTTAAGGSGINTGVFSNGTGKLSLAFVGVNASGNGFTSSNGFVSQVFAGANTYTGSTSHGRGTVGLDFSNAAAPATNILYSAGFVGANAAADDGKLIFTRPTITIGSGSAASGTLATLTLTGKASTTNSQTFNGLRLDANSAANVFINPNATANTVTLDLGPTVVRNAGSVVNFATTNATTALSGSAILKTTAGTASSTLVDPSGVAFATLGGRDWAGKNAANDTIVAATYTAATTSTLSGNADLALGSAANDVKLAANTSTTTVRFSNATRIGLNLGGNTLTTGGILISTISDNAFGSFIGNGTLKSIGTDLTFLQYAGTNNRFFGLNAVVADGASATGFTKGGTGITLLQGNNTFTGALNVQQGGVIVTGTNTAGSIFINGSQSNLMANQLPSTSTGGAFLQLGNANASGSLGSGVVNIGINSILGIKHSDAVTISNNVIGLGGLTQGWSGTTSLVSAGTAKYTYVGDTTVTAGTLKLDYAASDTGILSDSSQLVLGGGTVLYATAAGTANNDAVRGTTILAGASTVDKSGAGAGRLRLNSINTANAGSTLNFTAASIADTDTTNTLGILSLNGARYTLAGADWAMNSTNGGDGAITAYTAYTALSLGAGVDTVNSLQALTGTTTFTGSRNTNTLKLTNTSAAAQILDIAAGNILTLTAGGLLVTGTDAIQINNGTLRSAVGTNPDLLIHQYNSGGLTIGSVIANGAGVNTLTKSGTGTLTLGGTNTYTGVTYLNGGTTQISANANLGAVATGATLQMNNATLQATADVILSNGAVGTNNRAVVLNGLGGTFNVDATRTLTIGGGITGPGGLTKEGAGTLDIRNTTYTGPTTVNAGTLRFGASANPVYSAITVGASGTIDLFGFGNTLGSLAGAGLVTNSVATAITLNTGALDSDSTFFGTLSNTGSAMSLDKFGGGTLTLSGAGNSITGTITVSGGTLALSGSGVLTTATSTAGALTISSATGVFDISAIGGASTTIGSLASAVNSSVVLGSKTLITGKNDTNTTFAGVISGAGSLTRSGTIVVSNNTIFTLTGVNTYTGATLVDQGFLRIRDSVLVNTNGPLGNASSAVLLGNATSAVGGAFQANIGLYVQPVGDSDQLTFARPIDFSQAANNGTNNDRNRLRLEGNGTGGLDTTKLTISGDLTFGAHSTEFYLDRAGQTIDITGNASGTGAGTIYLTGNSSSLPTVDGAVGGTYRFSNVSRSFAQAMQLTLGRLVIDGTVGAVGTNSPIGRAAVNFSDGSGGNTITTRGRDATRSIFLETAGSSYARLISLAGGTGVTPTAGAQQNLYGTGQVTLMNGEQFGGLNTTGTVTFSGGIGGSNVAVSVTGTAGGLGGTNPISIVHNTALIAQTGGTSVFSGVISGSTAPTLGATGTPGAAGNANNLRLTINQFRNHPNLDEDKDGTADPGLANALVGNATTGTVVLSAANTHGGGTELLGGTLRIDHAQALSTVGNVTFNLGTGIVGPVGGTLQYGSGITTDLSARIKNSGGSIALDTNGNSVTYASALDSTNTNGLVKSGAGTLTLSTANTYTGATTISGGTLQLGAGGTTGSLNPASTITNNATLAFNRSNALVQGTDFASGIVGTGNVIKSGGGTTTLSGTNSYSGATTVTNGTLAVNGSLSATTAMNVNGGTLLLGAANLINDAAAVTLGGGTLNTGGFSDTLGSLTLSADSTIDFGAGSASELIFTTLTLGTTNNLNIWNWTATNPPFSADSGTSGDGLRDRLIFTSIGTLSAGELGRIHFFSDSGATAIADGFQITFGANQEIVPVPEPTAVLTALGLLGLGCWREGRRTRRRVR